MTLPDLIYKFYKHGGLIWTLVILLIGFILWLIAHPSVVKEWNTQITIWIAAIVPRKRKKAFEKRISQTIDTAKKRTEENMPLYMKKYLPYDLKVKWVGENDTLEAITEEKQIVVYVPTYKNDLQQVVSVLHSYCSEGFAQKAKIYMSDRSKKASDLVMTQRLAQNAGSSVYDYFNRVYLPKIREKDKSFLIALDALKKVDRDGLFLPVLMNELDKYANIIFPSEPSKESSEIIKNLMNFIYKIVSREPQERTPLTFCQGEIRIKVILAVGQFPQIDKLIHEINDVIRTKAVNTIYVLATGSKIYYAKEIAQRVYNQNIMDVYEPIETSYKRYTRRVNGADSICFELNIR